MEPREFEGKTDAKQVSDAEWQKLLTQEEFRILRKKGTEYPGTGEYNKFYPKEGTFHCAGCHAHRDHLLQLRGPSRPHLQGRRLSDADERTPLRQLGVHQVQRKVNGRSANPLTAGRWV